MANEVGTLQEVLAEGVSRRMAERWTGRTGGNRTVHFPPPEGVRPGDLLKIRIKRAGNVTLYGEAEKD
jgi:tRNA-2-methylthio-N6-dimethylallyladenosine synthase